MAEETEIQIVLDLDEAQAASLDTHSLVNIANVLSYELYHFGELSGEEKRLDIAIDRLVAISRTFSDLKLAESQIRSFADEVSAIKSLIAKVLEEHPNLKTQSDASESIANMASIFEILLKWVDEIIERTEAPFTWKSYAIQQLQENYTKVLGAIERNSKGRYRIIYNIAAQHPKDYYVDFKIDSFQSPVIKMPPVFIDVMRDLIANARKYTAPGGRISAGIWADQNELVLSVEDSGYGIPKDEIKRIVGFGQRGSNVQTIRTMGAGLGLTKAYYLTKKMNGRMWIRSEEGNGTRVKISLPRPQEDPSIYT
ncbi:MAG: sensor histidine kinase [Opitutales bacterium]